MLAKRSCASKASRGSNRIVNRMNCKTREMIAGLEAFEHFREAVRAVLSTPNTAGGDKRWARAKRKKAREQNKKSGR